MLAGVLKIFDFLPGAKSNIGAVVLVIVTVMQLLGADQGIIELVKKVAEALLVYGVAMKTVRKKV